MPTGAWLTKARMRTVATVALLVVMPLSASGFDDVIPARDAITWKRTEPYFRIGGRQAFVFGRNPTGWRTEQFVPLLEWAHDSGERILRIHITSGMTPKSPAGTVDEKWAGKWDKVFDQAAKQGLYVLPVFGAWAQWNDGSDGKPWHYWDRNRYNAKLGGPAKSPSELFEETRCQQLWLDWLAQMVRRWRNRPNIVAWEIFSELDLVTGAEEKTALQFVQRASSAVRKMDPAGRPVTTSLSGIREWPSLFSDDTIDLIQVHPYANHPQYRGQLDRMIIESVRARAKRYNKPVLIGESGFDSRPLSDATLDMAAHAEIGLRHAIWAAVVSGAINGRMFWWADGFDQYQKPDPELRKRYALLAKPAARFVNNIDWSDFKPIPVQLSRQLYGAAIGQKERIVAWFCDAHCIAPNWPTRLLAEQWVTLSVTGQTKNWRVTAYDPVTLRILDKSEVHREGSSLHVELPEFENAIVLDLTRDETGK